MQARGIPVQREGERKQEKGERGRRKEGTSYGTPSSILSSESVGHPASLFTSQLNGGGWRAFLKEERVVQAIKRHGLLSHLHCTCLCRNLRQERNMHCCEIGFQGCCGSRERREREARKKVKPLCAATNIATNIIQA